MRKLLLFFFVVVLLGTAWVFRGALLGWKQVPEYTAVSPEAAASAEAKLERLRAAGDTVRLSDVEFTSYMRYRFRTQLTGQLDSASIDFAGDTVTLTGRLPTDRLPSTREVEAMRYLMPDTADVRVEGSLRTLEPGRAALKVRRASFARVSIPPNVYPDALNRVGRRDEPGLGPDEYAFRLPPGVGAAQVEGGELVLAPAAATGQ
jgi:hypothetical protein